MQSKFLENLPGVVEARPLTVQDVAAVARISLEACPHARSTPGNPRYVEAGFRWYAHWSKGFVFTACCGRDLVGFVVGGEEGYDLSQAKVFWPWFVQAVRHCPWLLGERRTLSALWFQLRTLLRGEWRETSKPSVPTAVLRLIVVSEKFRGRGIAGVLMSVFEEEAAQRGFKRMRLGVANTNTSACRAYEKARWQREREEDPRWPDALWYTKEVPSTPAQQQA